MCVGGVAVFLVHRAIDGNANEVTEVLYTLDDTRTGEPKERKFWKESLQ